MVIRIVPSCTDMVTDRYRRAGSLPSGHMGHVEKLRHLNSPLVSADRPVGVRFTCILAYRSGVSGASGKDFAQVAGVIKAGEMRSLSCPIRSSGHWHKVCI